MVGFALCDTLIAHADLTGILERENATILNASLLAFAQIAVDGFRAAMKELDLTCPLFLTSNDGTLLTCDQAELFPIKTFSSGPTNSMRGASFLAGLASGGPRKETALVLDVGGTTTEVGVLLPTGFPRQAGARYELSGVPLNFSMPHVHSFGLGGGSRVRVDEDSGKVSVGPDSVGYLIDKEALVFGGETLTTTDIVVAAGIAPDVGDASKVQHISPELIEAARNRMKTMIELALDSMKTSTQDVPAYLVGGGAILVPDELKGISKVHRFPFFDAANAVGAACAQVSGIVDSFEDTSAHSLADVRKEVEQRAIRKAVEAGADEAQTVIVESETIPIAYTAGKARFYVKAAGPWTGEATQSQGNGHAQAKSAATNGHGGKRSAGEAKPMPPANVRSSPLPTKDVSHTPTELATYKPTVSSSREWILSELDVEWIAIGCYIMGCGGGGSPYSKFLTLREMIRAGAIIRVIDLSAMPDDSMCLWGGGIGSPEVSQERLTNEEMNQAFEELIKFCRVDKVGGLAALEIGGGNGMICMVSGASTYLDYPIIDGDFMGRAYPTGWQTTPNVYDFSGRGEMQLPCAMSSGDGNVVFMTRAKTDRETDSVLRAACVEMGTHAGAAQRPLEKAFCEKAMIKNTVSQAWRLGRAVALANKTAQIGNVGRILVDALGGAKTAKVLFAGKVTNVSRTIFKGHSYGEIVIQALAANEEEEDDPANPKDKYEGVMTSASCPLDGMIRADAPVPFKNENLYCEHAVDGAKKIVATVPDLIAVLDAQTGHALGTPDYKYGQRVMVLCITAAPQWTDTPRGLELGAMGAFGYPDVPYDPVGTYVKPRSVIEEYGPA